MTALADALDPDPAAASAPGEPVLTVERITAAYRARNSEVRAVDGVSLTVNANEVYGLAGESSCGKTTLLKTVVGAVRPPLAVLSGRVRFRFGSRTAELYGAAPPDWRRLRWRHLAVIPQGSMNVLNPVRRIRRSFVDFAFAPMGRPMPEFLERTARHLERLGLEPAVLDAFPHQLSGGMRQRVTIALATLCRPDLLVADEPTTALDVLVQQSVLALIRSVQREIGSSLLVVTHDLAVHAQLSDRLGIMYAGRLVEEGPAARLFAAARHPYTRHLVASLPRLGGPPPGAGLGGAPPSLAAPPPGCRFHPRCPLAMPVCRTEAPAMAWVAPGHRVACWAAGDAAP